MRHILFTFLLLASITAGAQEPAVADIFQEQNTESTQTISHPRQPKDIANYPQQNSFYDNNSRDTSSQSWYWLGGAIYESVFFLFVGFINPNILNYISLNIADRLPITAWTSLVPPILPLLHHLLLSVSAMPKMFAPYDDFAKLNPLNYAAYSVTDSFHQSEFFNTALSGAQQEEFHTGRADLNNWARIGAAALTLAGFLYFLYREHHAFNTNLQLVRNLRWQVQAMGQLTQIPGQRPHELQPQATAGHNAIRTSKLSGKAN